MSLQQPCNIQQYNNVVDIDGHFTICVQLNLLTTIHEMIIQQVYHHIINNKRMWCFHALFHIFIFMNDYYAYR